MTVEGLGTGRCYEFVEHGVSGEVRESGMTEMEYDIHLTTMSTALTACIPVITVATALSHLCIIFSFCVV